MTWLGRFHAREPPWSHMPPALRPSPEDAQGLKWDNEPWDQSRAGDEEET
jgi:hypothetical protein